MTLQEKLKEATNTQHDALEQHLFVSQIMDGSLTAEQYRKLLAVNYFSHLVFEEELFQGLSTDLQAELCLGARGKLTALSRDLAEMPLTNINFNRDSLQVIPHNDASILGALYVMEGATLGGNVIVKRLKINKHLAPLNLSFQYYQVYGEQLVTKWKEFLEVLNTQVAEADHQKAIDAANAMFSNMLALAQQ